MAFEGDLKNLPLADVLQTINQNNLTGCLTVKDAKGERRIAFSQGFIVAFQPAPGEARPVIDALHKRRLVARSEAERARGGFLGKRKTLRMALASRGLVTEEDYVRVVKEDVLEGIYELFLESDRTFHFQDGTPDLSQWDQDQLAAEIRLPAAPIVMEGARRCDEWGRIRRMIGSFDEVLVRDGGPEEDDDEITKELLQLADGSRRLGEVLENLPVARFKGCEAAAQLISSRRLRPASTNEYVGLGQQAEDQGRFDEAAKLYERGLAVERGNLTLRQRRASALERAGRRTEAADERKMLAVSFLEQGKRSEAAEELSRAADLSPRDPGPLERRLQIAHEDQDQDVARVTAARLAALFEDLGLAEKARDALRAHLARWPDDDEVREKLAELLHRQGDPRGALAEWVELGNRALRVELHALAAVRFKKALELDPADQNVRALLHDIESGEITARRIRRMKRIYFALTMTVFLSFIAVVVWNGIALYALHEVHLDVGYPRVATGTPEGVYEALGAVMGAHDAYPYTAAAWEADRLELKMVSVYVTTFEASLHRSLFDKTKFAVGPTIGDEEIRKMVEQGYLEDPKKENSLEGHVRSAEAHLASSDSAGAAQEFGTAQDKIQHAIGWLEKTSPQARHEQWLLDVVDRIDRSYRRVRVGKVRMLPLSGESRSEFERLIGPLMSKK